MFKKPYLRITLWSSILLLCQVAFAAKPLPEGFTYLNDPRIEVSLKFSTADNFVGRKIKGYEAPVAILTAKAAEALIKAQDELDTMGKGYRLRVLDAYQPKVAVLDLRQWIQDSKDVKMKTKFYPTFQKTDLVKEGFLPKEQEDAHHTRGSTLDLTIVEPDPSQKGKYRELDMGTIYQFFGERSHTDDDEISGLAQYNRNLLKKVMEKHGFENEDKKWWQYTLEDEPFPDTYFDFVIQ